MHFLILYNYNFLAFVFDKYKLKQNAVGEKICCRLCKYNLAFFRNTVGENKLKKWHAPGFIYIYDLKIHKVVWVKIWIVKCYNAKKIEECPQKTNCKNWNSKIWSAPIQNCQNWPNCIVTKFEIKLCHFLRSNPRFLRNEVDRKLFEPLKLKLMKNQFSPLAFQPMVVIFLLWKQFGLILVVVIPWSQKGLLSPTWSFFIG